MGNPRGGSNPLARTTRTIVTEALILGGSLNTTVERLNAHTVKLTITVPAADVDAAIDAAYKSIAGKIKIPGFRPGRAPKPMIDTHVGRDYVHGEAQDELLNSAYSKAIDAESLRPIARPEVDEPAAIERGKDYEFTATVEVRPELALSSVEGLSITVPSVVTTDAEIDAQIEHTRERFATLEPVEGRALQADDFALISFVGTVDGEEYEGNTVDRYLYEVGRGMMPEAFDEGLIGAEAGAEKSVEFEIPDTSSNPDFVGKTARFEVTIHEIKAKTLPAIDDEFAANVGGYESVAEMRQSLRETMDSAKQTGRLRAIEREARATLAARLEGEVPEAMVDTTRGQMMRDFMTGMESRGISLPEYLQATGSDMDRIESDIAEQAKRSVTEDLALEALFRHLDFVVTDADIDAEIAMISSQADKDPAELRSSFEDSGVIAVLREQVMHNKAMAWLIDPANVAVVEAAPETASDAAADADAETPEADTEKDKG